MWFNIGIGELVLIASLGLVAAVLAIVRVRIWRWAAVGVVSAGVAAVLTPADPLSTLLIAAVFCLFYVGGTRFGGKPPVAAA